MSCIENKAKSALHLLAAALVLLPVYRIFAQRTTPPDAFAAIATDTEAGTNDLVVPAPPKLPHKIIAWSAHDPNAVFQPAKKMETAAELADALAGARRETARFLEDHAPALVPTRTVQALTRFDWRIARAEDWQNFPATLAGAGDWQSVTVPHFGEPLGRTNTFYRTTFTLADWKSNQAVFVRFRGVDYRARVFINGAFAGAHEGFFAPFEFDITPFARPGENVLFVEVENDFPTLGVVNDPRYPDLMGDKLYAATGPGFDDPEAGWHHDPPGMGIYQPVTVEIRPRIFVHDIFVRPLPDSAADAPNAEALIEVWNCDVAPREVEVQFAVHGLNFAQAAIAPRRLEKIDKAGAGVNFYRVRFRVPDARRWTPEEPWLYAFEASVSCAEIGSADRARRQFGLRTFRLDESGHPRGTFQLNGATLRLRGANTMGFEQQDVMRGELDRLRDDFLLAKIAHLNFLRITQRPVQEEIYDMADRLGLMIQTDFPLFGHMRPNQFAEGVRQAGEMERLIRSHPSCVLVTWMNERFSDPKSRGKIDRRMNHAEMEGFFRALTEAVHQQNPDRAIKPVEGDYDPPAAGLPDNHCYTLWYFRNGIDFGRLHRGYWQPVKPDWNYACGEFGAEGLDRIELMRAHCPSNWLPANADDEKTWTPARIARAQTAEMYPNFFDKPRSLQGWVDASREHQAFAARLMTEAFRRDNRMVSFAIHLFIDAWPTGWMKALVDVERQPKPAYFAYREALTPLMANIRTDRWKFFSGEKMKCEFWICNDTSARPAHPTLAWELELDGKIVHAQRGKATVEPVQSVFQGFTAIPVPAVTQRTPAKLRLALFDGDRLVHDTAVDVEFFPSPAPIAAAVKIIGARNGPAARLARDLKLRIVKDGSAPVCLIDDYAQYDRRRAEIDSAIENGVRAIFLNLPKGEYVLPGSSARITVQSANPHFLSRATGHPLAAGFEPFDFRFWFDASADMITPLANGKFNGAWNPVLLAQNANAVAERSFGRGRVILCEALLAGRVGTNPTARMFAAKLIRGW